MKFEEIIEKLPKRVLDKLINLKNLRERPDYHPEDSCYEHIKIVYERLLVTNNPDLYISAIFHDICKLDCLSKNSKTGYPSSPGHDLKAFEYINNSSLVKKFIISQGASVSNVSEICLYHMRIKNYEIMRESKKKKLEELTNFENLLIFKKADDMLTEFVF